MISAQRNWSPALETLAHEKMRRLQLAKCTKIFIWAYEHSKFHKRLYKKAEIKPGNIRSFEDIPGIPTVEKSMVRRIQWKDAFPFTATSPLGIADTAKSMGIDLRSLSIRKITRAGELSANIPATFGTVAEQVKRTKPKPSVPDVRDQIALYLMSLLI